jgi:hypothetical protein
MKYIAMLVGTLQALVGFVGTASAKDMIDYFQPIPVNSPLTSNAWGEPGVRPRDTSNGLESTNNQYFYWDGKVTKTTDGKYHLHCSRWPKSGGFNQWASSIAVHAVSDTLLGPYVDQGQIYDRISGRGHNVSSLVLPDGTFAVYTSDVSPGDFYTATSINGPWTFKGSMEIDLNGHEVAWPRANISVIVRPDNTFLATQRSGNIMVGGTDLLGPYVVQGPSVYPVIQGLDNSRAEDPVIWYSGGHYHITVNWWDSRVARHLMSKDGVHDWKDMGVAYDPRSDFIRYTDGTVNHWYNLERPGVVMENGHVVAFTFAATDINKSSVTGTDNSGSKIIVVPFDGASFDADFGDGTGVGGTGGNAGTGGLGGGSVGGTVATGGSPVAGNTSATGGASGMGGGTGGSSTMAGSSAQSTAGSNSGGGASGGSGALPDPTSPGSNGCACRAASVPYGRAAWWSLPLVIGAAALCRRKRRVSRPSQGGFCGPF